MTDMKTRFLSKVRKTESCWLWTGATNDKGYGYFWEGKGKWRKAHRVSLSIHGVDIPSGMVVDHICRVRNCVNPAHLRVVTQRQNALENNIGPVAMHNAATHCPKGHSLSGDNLEPWELRRGRRKCVICKVEAARRWRAKVAATKQGESNENRCA